MAYKVVVPTCSMLCIVTIGVPEVGHSRWHVDKQGFHYSVLSACWYLFHVLLHCQRYKLWWWMYRGLILPLNRKVSWNSCTRSLIKQTNSMVLSPQANYTDWATATCRRNLVPTFVDRGVSRGQRGGSPTVVNLSFLDRTRSLITGLIFGVQWKPMSYVYMSIGGRVDVSLGSRKRFWVGFQVAFISEPICSSLWSDLADEITFLESKVRMANCRLLAMFWMARKISYFV
jgi:hypothetical protein